MRSGTTLWARVVVLVGVVVSTACASGAPGASDAGGPGSAVDASTGVDGAAPLPAPPGGQEIIGGADRLTGGKFTLDVEVGHGIGQSPVQAKDSATRVEGAAVVKP